MDRQTLITPYSTRQTPEERREAALRSLAARLSTAAALSRREAAVYVGLSDAQLRNPLFCGPRFRRAGRRIIYLRSDLDAWLAALPVDGGTTPGRAA